MDAKQTPLIELLERVPKNGRCRVDEPDGMGSVFFPVGKLCHEAATELRRLHAEVENLRCHVHTCHAQCSKAGCINRRLFTQADRDTALLRQALEALCNFDYDKRMSAIAAMRERLNSQ